MILCLILFTVVCAAEYQVLTESFVIKLKELETVIREQRAVIENMKQMNNIGECFEILTNVKQRLVTGKMSSTC